MKFNIEKPNIIDHFFIYYSPSLTFDQKHFYTEFP